MKNILWLDHNVFQGSTANQIGVISKLADSNFKLKFYLADNPTKAEQILKDQPKIDLLILNIVIECDDFGNYTIEETQGGFITGTVFATKNIKKLADFNVPILVYAVDIAENRQQFKIIQGLKLRAYFLRKLSTSYDVLTKIKEIFQI